MTDTTTPPIDEAKLAAFGATMLGILNHGSAALMISVGHQVRLFDAMATLPSSTSHEIATAAGLHERYVREWLGAMATAGIIDYDAGLGGFRLRPEHAALTTRAAGPDNLAAYMQFVPVCAAVESQVVERFRVGGGVPYTSYARFHQVMAELSGAGFDAGLVDAVLPLVPGIVERLHTGIDVMDVGTGSGHAVNVMARAFPNSRFVGIDFSDEALAAARAEASAWGLTNTAFEVRDAATLDGARMFDFVTTFDAVHDQAHPEAMVRGIHAALAPGRTGCAPTSKPRPTSVRTSPTPSARSATRSRACIA